MAHTPTPWHTGNNDFEIYQAALVFDPKLRAVADCQKYEIGRSRGECEANAAFIIRACNAHDALLQAARLVVAGGDQCFCHAGPTSWGRHRLDLGPGPCDWCVAKKAVALAEGGKDGAE